MTSAVRQSVLVDIAYEIGGAGIAAFTNMLAAYRAGKYAAAAAEIKNSLLYTQVPRREQENMMIMATGMFPPQIMCARDLVRRHEGCIFTAKPDDKGKWVNGWGHDMPPPGQPGHVAECTQDVADDWLSADLALATLRAKAAVGAEYWEDAA